MSSHQSSEAEPQASPKVKSAGSMGEGSGPGPGVGETEPVLILMLLMVSSGQLHEPEHLSCHNQDASPPQLETTKPIPLAMSELMLFK